MPEDAAMSAHDTAGVGSGETCGYDGWADGEAHCRCGMRFESMQAFERHIGYPASPDPVQPADAGEGLSEAERADLSMAIIRAGYNGDGQVFDSVERILAAREAEWAERYAAVVGERDAQADAASHYGELAVKWQKRSNAHRIRAESAEAALATAREDGYQQGVREGREQAETRDLDFDALTDERDTALREKAEDRALRGRVEGLADLLGVQYETARENGSPLGFGWVISALGDACNELRAALAIPTATGDES